MRAFTLRPSAFALAFALGLATAAVAPLTARAADETQTQKESEEAYESFLDYSHEQKDDAVSWAERQLAAIDAEIETLESDWDKSETRAGLQDLRADLERKRDAAARELEDLGDASAEAWRDAKVEAKEAMSDLEQAYRDTRRKIAD